MADESGNGDFSADEEAALGSVLDEIVPPAPGRDLPGAGGLGLVAFLAGFVRKMPMLKPVIAQGLSALDEIARRRDARGFAALSAPDRKAVLDELAAADQTFLPTLTFVTYVGYYQNPRVVAALGLEPRPPHPQGYDVDPDDLTLLDPVRARPKMYRDA